MTSKGAIFDLFYGKQQSSRSGGGTLKTKMCRLKPNFEAMEIMANLVREDPKLFDY